MRRGVGLRNWECYFCYIMCQHCRYLLLHRPLHRRNYHPLTYVLALLPESELVWAFSCILALSFRNVCSLLGWSCCASHRFHIRLTMRLLRRHVDLLILSSCVQHCEEALQYLLPFSGVQTLPVCPTCGGHIVRNMVCVVKQANGKICETLSTRLLR